MSPLLSDVLTEPERERMLRAMAELCAERGYLAIEVGDIVERSGVDRESFAASFADIEQCAIAAVNAILAEVMTTVSTNYSADRAERDSYLLAIKSILELLAHKPAFTNLSFICARQMAPPRVSEGLETGARMLSAMLERLYEDSGGEWPTPPSSAARAGLGGAEAVVRREVMAGRSAELPGLLPSFIYTATVSSLGQEEAMRLTRRASQLLSEDA